MSILERIQNPKGEKFLAILIDPEKTDLSGCVALSQKIKASPATHVLVGGSTFSGTHLDKLISLLQKETELPVLLFPGNYTQISPQADGLLFLSLLSGRNPDYLVENQVNAVPFLAETTLEVIPTAYLLVDGGNVSAVERVSGTKPLQTDNPDYIAQTAKAGEYLGQKLIYLEAGSGAKNAVPSAIIEKVVALCTIPVIVGGGIKSRAQIEAAYNAGASMVVIGTAFETNIHFFES